MIPKRYVLLLLALVLFAAGFVCHRFHRHTAAQVLWFLAACMATAAGWAFYVQDA